MVSHFIEEEVYEGLMSCRSNKALGPDNLNFHFYKNAWNIMKTDILLVFHEFYKSGKLPRGINSSFMVLTPKVAGTCILLEFWPISLINGIYKMISKVLSFRLRAVLLSIIAENQQAFLKGRIILDCSIMANEVLHILSKCKKTEVLC